MAPLKLVQDNGSPAIVHDFGPITVHLRNEGLTEAQARRLQTAFGYYEGPLRSIAEWTVKSRENFNFTYDVHPRTRERFAGALAVATGLPISAITGYIREIDEDQPLRELVIERAKADTFMDVHDLTCMFGRRIAWYAAIRATKPKVVVETGVDKGLGSMLICAALIRNAIEGAPGRYIGTDLMPDAGYLLHGIYREVATILTGDSVALLEQMTDPIDLFIHDSDHSPEYERRELDTILPKLSAKALVLSDNSHTSDSLFKWSLESGRSYLYCNETPANHWYPGAGVGISFTAPA